MNLPAPKLSDARGTAVIEYVEDVKALLYLQAWRIDLPDEYPTEDPEDALAEILPTEGRYIASIRFGPDFWPRKREDQRAIIVHELLHLHHARVTETVRVGAYKESLGQNTYDQLWKTLQTETEYMVDILTTIIAPHVPLPPKWPE